MAFKYDEIKLTWHRIYIVLLYFRGCIGILYGLFNYTTSFSQLNFKSYYFSEDRYSTLILLYILLLCIDLTRIILEFNTASKIKDFKPAGYNLNDVLHGFLCISYFFIGIIKGSISQENEEYTIIAGFIISVIWGVAVWLPIHIYYSKRSDLFSNENPNNNLQVVLVTMPSDILEACEEHSFNEEEYNNFVESLLSSNTITRKQAEALQTLYYPSKEEWDDYIDHLSLDDIENLLSSKKITQEQAEALQTLSYLNEESMKEKEAVESTSNLDSNSSTYCRKCGTKLPSDSTFCNNCGFSITKRDSKKIVCNLCNHLISKDSEFCPYCGQQLEKHLLNKSIKQKRRLTSLISIITLSVIILSLGTLNIIQHKKSQDDRTTIELYEKGYKEKDNRIAQLNDEIEELEKKVKNYDDLNDQVDFYKEYAVIIQNDGTGIYHTYTCPKIDLYTYNFVIYNEGTAVIQGYKACAYCQE